MSSPSNSPTRQTQGHPCFLQPVNNITTPNLNPAFHSLLEHLSIPIHPFISCIDGSVHSDFPETLLAYHLLTSDALDNLARHYHQVSPPVHGTSLYPNQIEAWIGTPDEVTTGLKTKRFRFGRFIGLQCCESPCFEPEPGLRDPVYRPELDANHPRRDEARAAGAYECTGGRFDEKRRPKVKSRFGRFLGLSRDKR